MSQYTPQFNSETFTVKVQNIPKNVYRDEVVALFRNLVGTIFKSEERFNDGSRTLNLTFNDRDASMKALCMSGYTIAGTPLIVTAVSSPTENHLANGRKDADTRRNLYVLGLPFDFSKAEFAALFAPYGTVSHCVILATRDSASRRRGFVVMSTHEEAKTAMAALSRRSNMGITLDISWAVVQRSQGFLDGGDRAAQLDDKCSSVSGGVFLSGEDTGSAPIVNPTERKDHGSMRFLTVAIPTPTLLVTNLPSSLFSQLLDLHPLLCPFGRIKKLQVLDSDFQDALAGKMSVLVDYETVSSANEAKEMLHGQFYAHYPVQVFYIQVAPPPMTLENSTSSLNPFAPPFVHGSRPRNRSGTVLASQAFPYPSQYQKCYESGTDAFQPTATSSRYPSSLGISRSSMYSRQSTGSRSSSASSRLSTESSDHLHTGNQAHLSLVDSYSASAGFGGRWD